MKWFKHLTDAMDDLFVKDLERKYGDSGYAFWFKTLELIGNHGEAGKLEISWANYLEKLHKRRTQVELMLNFCSTSGKLSVMFSEDNVIIECKKFAEYSDNYTKYGKTLQSDFKEPSKQEEEEEVEVDKKEKKIKSAKKKEGIVKAKYGDDVFLTEEEHRKLIDKLGSESRAKICIEILDNAKGAKGYVYKSDYKAILSWVIGELEKRENGGFKKTIKPEPPSGLSISQRDNK